ncbi:hypothetical protein [Nevskia soli]|jgi:hypothetical protein|uniref:hypothetical protein n=1 Tax=Nevskia soli TaxID=418856 RepID=UPI0015D74968|nr:hypothetical protein [Nevskia soli]
MLQCSAENNMYGNFKVALIAYTALALIAGFALDGKIRLFVWILLGGLAIKTWAAHKAGW